MQVSYHNHIATISEAQCSCVSNVLSLLNHLSPKVLEVSGLKYKASVFCYFLGFLYCENSSHFLFGNQFGEIRECCEMGCFYYSCNLPGISIFLPWNNDWQFSVTNFHLLSSCLGDTQ